MALSVKGYAIWMLKKQQIDIYLKIFYLNRGSFSFVRTGLLIIMSLESSIIHAKCVYLKFDVIYSLQRYFMSWGPKDVYQAQYFP